MADDNRQDNLAGQTELTATTRAKLRALGFDDSPVESPRRLVASVGGREKTGKSHLALTAPDPIFYFNIDLGTEGVVRTFQDNGKQVFIYTIRVRRKNEQQADYKKIWDDFQLKIRAAYDLDIGSVVVDTASEAYELARLAHFGKLTQVMPHNYVEVNNEWRDLLGLAFDAKHMNTIHIHKMKPKYLNGNRTNEYELSGFSETDYAAQVNLLTYRHLQDDGPPEFSAYIKDVRIDSGIKHMGTTLTGQMCDFEFLLNLIHGPKKKKRE